MAKWSKTQVGSIIKGKDGKPDYLKIKETITLNKGDILNLESQKSQTDSINKAIAEGKMDADFGQKLLESVSKMPSFVRFNVTKSQKL